MEGQCYHLKKWLHDAADRLNSGEILLYYKEKPLKYCVVCSDFSCISCFSSLSHPLGWDRLGKIFLILKQFKVKLKSNTISSYTPSWLVSEYTQNITDIQEALGWLRRPFCPEHHQEHLTPKQSAFHPFQHGLTAQQGLSGFFYPPTSLFFPFYPF